MPQTHMSDDEITPDEPQAGHEPQKGECMKGQEYCRILGTRINVTNMEDTIGYITGHLEELKGHYICVSNVHTTVMAYKDSGYQKIQNHAAMALPDGKPLSLVSKIRGHRNAGRVPGPDVMTEIFSISREKGYTHYFYGSSQHTIDCLKETLGKKYPGLKIVGMVAPPFRELTSREDEEAVRAINKAAPDFLWVGLGAPKQEVWMAAHEGRVNSLMLGVGAGFDFHAGTARRAPSWIQEAYMEWLFRLIQNPKRLFKRYFQTNIEFIILIAGEELRRRAGVKDWCRSAGVMEERLKRRVKAGKKPRMLIYAHYYYPDVASTGQLLTELAESLADRLDITVICVVPSYIGKVPGKYSDKAYYYESRNGVNMIRVRVPSYTKKQVSSRVINITTYFRRAIVATFRSGRQDYIFSISQPPVFGGILGVIGKIVKHAKFIYNIQDFNPEQVNAVEYTRSRAMIATMMAADKISCRAADKIVLVGRDMVDTLKNRFDKNMPPYCVINNWIDENEITPLPAEDPGVLEFREKYGLTGKFVFMYSGNIGLYYDLEKIMRVLLRFRGRDDLVFAFAGGGAILDRLVAFRNKHHMDNVLFIPYQEKRRLIYSLNAADIHWVVNAKGIKGVSVPSKLYGIMAAGKPVIGLLEEGTEARMIIEDSRCGFVDDPGNENSIERLIGKVLDNRDALPAMGMSGREYLVKNLSKQKSIERYYEEITG